MPNFVLLFIPTLLFGLIPLSNSPTWTSVDFDYSTGGGFWDIDNNGFIDFAMSNGNDMAWNRNSVYLNNNGILETNASWRSSDSGQFGHLYLGDVNNDGLIDMATVFLGFGAVQGSARIYLNLGTGFEPNPYWVSQDQYNSFDCALGDVDLDGDLDLAVVSGDAYNNFRSPVRLYRNNGGVFESLPYWTSQDSQPSDAIRFADLDKDGDLDLIVGYRNKIAVFQNFVDSLEHNASWSVTTGVGWVIRMAIGDYDNDGWLDLAVAANGQLGDPNRIMVFHNQNGTIENTPRFIMLRNPQYRYSSCVAWGDANGDGYLDLAAGGWWEPVVVFENHSGILDTIPTWSYSAGNNLVCETVLWGDIGNNHLSSINEQKTGDGTKKLFYLAHNPIQSLHHILLNGDTVNKTEYCFDPLTGWVSFRNAPTQGANIEIAYQYSNYPDLAVTNWVSYAGSYLFENTTPGFIAENYLSRAKAITVFPNPFNEGIEISLPQASMVKQLEIYAPNGRCVKTFNNLTNIRWDGCDDQGNRLPNGIYFLRLNQSPTANQKIIKL